MADTEDPTFEVDWRPISWEEQQEPPKKECPYELRSVLEEFFYRLSLYAAQESAVTPFDTQFAMLVSQYTDEAIQEAVLLTSEDNPESSSYTGRLPVHLACDMSAPVSVIRFLIERDARKESIRRPDKWGDLPIHTACSRKDYEEVIDLLISADPQTILTKDDNGMLPLHMACRYGLPADVVSLLLESDTEKKSLFVKAIYGQLPIHVAARQGAPPSVLKVLLSHDDTQSSVLREDDVGRIPLHLAFLRNQPHEVVDVVLGAMIRGRMERLGLVQWKRNMASFLRSMSSTSYHERDFMTREKLNVVSKAIEELLEWAVLIELAVWRECCLNSMNEDNGRRFDTMGAVVECSREHGFDMKDYKASRRIKSGAEEIVRSVVPFLEDEPIEKYKREFPAACLAGGQ